MLFDLEDYVSLGIIGPNSKHPKLINWSVVETTSRMTRDAYLKSVNEHFLAAQAMSTPAEFQALKVKHVAFLEAFVNFGPKYKTFWDVMVSLPLAEIEGFTEGTKFDIFDVAKYDQNTNYIEYPASQPNSSWWMDNYRTIAIIDPNGSYTYTTSITSEMTSSYRDSFIDLMAAVKDIFVTAEGKPENLIDWVVPEVMPYETYPELSGYVRGTNSLSIQNAVVRLTDAEGVTHDVVTDSKGYYIFTKEFIYNNVSLGATGSVFDLNMNLLPTKTDGTVLYNTTSKFQNSFFGAVNNRGFNWPQRLIMNKPARRNFKIEFIPDYTNFPSFRGYVKDAAGNAIKDALVAIKDPFSGFSIGQYRKPNGDDAWNYKYNDFGTDRTILTDENGFYEYTSQMVGEWFNKHGFVEYGIPTTVLTEPTRTYEDGNMQRWFMSNEFIVYLIPFKQDANSTSMSDGTPIYDNNSYSDSRFEYALSNVGQQFYYRDIEMNQNNVFDVNVVPAVGNEVMADKIKITCTPKSQNISGYFRSTTGYVKFVFSNGVSEVRLSGWIDFQYNSYNYDTTMFSEEFYLYSCDNEGRAFGYITECNLGDTESSNVSNIDFSESEQLARLTIWGLHSSDLDVSNLSKLERIYLAEDFYLQTVSGLENCKRLTNITLQNNRYLNDFPIVNLPWLSEINIIGTELLSLDFSTISKKVTSINIILSGIQSLQSTNFGFIGHTASSYTSITIDGCSSLLVDDIDSTLQQLADSGKQLGYLSTDMARSSDSDSAFDTLSNSGWSLNFGSKYFESNEIKKSVVMYVDPSFGPSSNQSQKSIYLTGEVTTTTGYFRLKSWYDNGSPQNNNIYGGSFYRTINVEFDDTYESRPVEIYSTDEYGRPSGTITQILLNNQNNEDFKNIVDVDFSQATEITNLEIRKFGITSLNLTSNVMLSDLIVYSCGKIDTLFVNNLVSLETIYIYDSNALTSIEGFDTLTSLYRVQFENCQMLDFVSYSELTSINEINISDVFKYDSTHVDTILSELKTISDNRSSVLNAQLATKQAEHPVKLAELQALMAQEPTVSTLGSERDALLTQLESLQSELSQLISDGVDQSLIDAKQGEVDTKQAELVAKQLELDLKLEAIKAIDTQLVVLDAEIADLNSQISNLFANSYFNSDVMARTSDSDADYSALITYGWQLNLGSTFFAPYTEPVKGYITLDWDGNDQRYITFNNSSNSLVTTTGYYTFKDGSGNIYSGSSTNAYFYAYKGVLEFWSTDSFGRTGGEFTHIEMCTVWSGPQVEQGAIVAVDLDNLTSLGTLSIYNTGITTLDVSNLINLDYFGCEFNNKLVSITGLDLLYKLRIFRLRECTKLTNVDTSGLESLRTLYLDSNSSLSDIDISNIGSKDITGLNFDTEFANTFAEPGTGFKYHHIVELPDGKFMAAGYSDTIARFNSDGSIDDTFTYITMTEASGSVYIYAMDVQADGKVLVGGQFDTIGGVTQSTIARINTDGTIDETFLASDLLYGPVWDNGSFVGQKCMNTIKVQPDGKILIGGYFVVPSVNMYGLVRLNSDGTIDSTFINGLDLPAGNLNGFSRLGGAYEDPRVIELQPDGKILVGCSQWNGWFLESGTDADGVYITKPIYRLNSDGTLDTTFDPDNNLSAAFFSNNYMSYVNSIAVDSTGRIIIGGWIYRTGFLGEQNVVNNLVRLNSDGTFNHDFSTVVDGQGITRSFSVGKINKKSLFFIDDKLFVGAYGRSYILDENDNISEYIDLQGGYESNQLTGAILTSNNKLIIVGQFSNTINVWPTEITVGSDSNWGVAAFNYETYNFKSLSSLTIYNQDFETPKYLDVHENIIEIDYNYFRTFTSADLDTLLTELDTNGRSNGSIYTGYVARTEASDVAYNNLQSKGWSLGLGSYFIGPNEEPAKGYIHYEDTSINESINFLVYTEANYYVIKYPDGTTETRNDGWVYYDFNSSIPAEERIFEIYGADQFGRPTDSITNITDLNECSSVDFSALKKLRSVGLDQNDRITTLNLDGVVSLESVFVNNCKLLETISIVGCTASKRDSYMNSCPLLDIDAFLIQLDETGSLPHEYGCIIYAHEQWGNGLTPARTHASTVAVESLIDKGFIINVAEPAGQVINFSVISGQDLGMQFSSSTGYVKMIYPTGSTKAYEYPNGQIFGNGNKYVSLDNYSQFGTWETFTQNMNISIESCTQNGVSSGEIRLLQIDRGVYNLNLSTLTKVQIIQFADGFTNTFNGSSISFNGMSGLKKININGNNQTNISSIDISYLSNNLKSLEISISNEAQTKPRLIGLTVDCSLTNLRLEGISATTSIDFTKLTLLEHLHINGIGISSINLSVCTSLKSLYIHSCNSLTSLNVSNTILESIYLYDSSNIQSITGLSTLTDLGMFVVNNLPVFNQQLDFTGMTKLWILEIYNLPQLTTVTGLNYFAVDSSNNGQANIHTTGITSLDFSNSKLGQISLESNNSLTSLNLTNCSNFYRIWVYNGNNNLSSIQGLNTCSNLHYFYLYSGSMVSLDFNSNNLRDVVIQNISNLVQMSGLNNRLALGEINIAHTGLQSLDLSGSSMNNLNVSASPITSLNLSNTAISYLGLNSLQITSLDLGVLSNTRSLQGIQMSSMTTLTSFTNLRTTMTYVHCNSLPNLLTVSVAGLTNLNNVYMPGTLNSTGMDNLLIQLVQNNKSNGYFYSPGYNTKRTSASDSAKATLISRGWNLQG
jgi:uncharacterized delta-60 repeat protein